MTIPDDPSELFEPERVEQATPPAMTLAAYFPEAVGRPTSVDISWAESNPGALMVALRLLLGLEEKPDAPEADSRQLRGKDFNPAPRPLVADAPVGKCGRLLCGHPHDRHRRADTNGMEVKGADGMVDLNGGQCVVCDNGRLCSSFVWAAETATAGEAIGAGTQICIGRDGKIYGRVIVDDRPPVGIAGQDFSEGDAVARSASSSGTWIRKAKIA